MSYWLSSIIVLLPKLFFSVVFLSAAIRFMISELRFKSSVINYKSLIIGSAGFRVFYAAFLTIVQYYVWSQSEFTRVFLKSSEYFLFYSYGRFWLNVLISIGAAFAFYLFLKFLQKHRERFFEEGETELGFLTALIVGWPNFVIFLPLVFISVVLISVFRRLFFGEAYTTLGIPFLLATLLAFLFGHYFIKILHLTALAI